MTKQHVICRVMTDGKETKRISEKRTVYTNKDGSTFVRSMGRKLPLVNGVYEFKFTSVRAYTFDEILKSASPQSGRPRPGSRR